MTKSNLFSLATGIVEITLLGLILFINPDYFFNPLNGIFKALSFLNEDAIVIPRVKLDDLTYYSLACYGVGIVSIGGMYLLAGKDRLLKKEILRSKFWLAALAAHVCVHAAFVYDLVGINKPAVAFWGGLSVTNTLWALAENLRLSKRPDLIPRTKPTTLQLMTLLVDCAFCGLWAISLVWFPHSLEPATGNPFSMMKATPKEDNTWMDIHLFTVRMEGVPMMVFTLCMLELVIFDRSVEAIRANNKFALVCCMFYTVFFLRLALWCEYADKAAIAVNVLGNIGLSTFIFKCGPNIFEAQPTPMTPAADAKDLLKSEAPDLVSETKKVS